MEFCDWCKSADTFVGACPNCGKILCVNEKCKVIFGTKESAERADIRLTNKYMILNTRSAGEKALTSTLGLLGIFIYVIFNPDNRYGFYDLKEIEKVIYPYRNKKLKNNVALKIVNKDGSDLIIKEARGYISMERLANCFQKAGVMIDSSCKDYGNIFCSKPFVDKKTMGVRICPSAAGFVRFIKGNFVADPIKGVEQSEQEKSPKRETFSWRSTEEKEYKFCFKCGMKLNVDDVFCRKCGSKQ